jgi:hypothetical protein
MSFDGITTPSKVEKGKCDTCLNTMFDHVGLITEISWLY